MIKKIIGRDHVYRLKLRHLIIALACQAITVPSYGAFIDSLERTSPELGGLGTNVRMTAVTHNGKNLIIVGPRGLVLSSDDDGKSWIQSLISVSSDLVAVQFHSNKLGWAVGHDGVIIHTADGGLNWVKQLDGYQTVSRIKEHYDLEGAGAASLPEPLRGELENMVADGADKPFLDVLFVSEAEGFAVGAFNLAMRTVDGGQTWTPIIEKTNNPDGYHLYGLAVAGGDIYLSGERGLLRRWDRDAQAFIAVEVPYEGSFFGVLGKGANILFAYGLQGNVYRSVDRGETWTLLDLPGQASITGATLLPDGRIVFVDLGGRALVTADDGASFIQLSGRRAMPYFDVAPVMDEKVLVVGRGGPDFVSIPVQPDSISRR